MNLRWVWSSVSILLLALLVTACDEQLAPVSTLPPPPAATSAPTALVPQPTPGVVQPTAAPKATAPQPATASTPTLVKAAVTCPANAPLPANAQLAARVNGQGIALDLFNRQVAQATSAFLQQGIDPKSPGGQEAIKSLRQQVLDQMINDVVIAQQAEKEGLKLTDNDLNARLAQMIQDAGSVDKLNEYLSKNQLSLADFCAQIRANIVGEAMLNQVTKALPSSVEQVHVRQILVASPQLAQQLLTQLRAGADFAALAKQYSLDEASKVNGGDLGWAPKGRFDPQFEAIAFQLKPGQISDVVQTQFGYHIIKVDEHENSRPLPPELIQNSRQQAFLAWLQAVRQGMKIERFVQP
ncbi:MAG: peptidylprolyl isomerase [Chloroflexi bacterium]|nr:peptidylprolyl isomerase [Chloroflexota bacterium]